MALYKLVEQNDLSPLAHSGCTDELDLQDRLLIETDGPYMCPEPSRGHTAHPGPVHLLAPVLTLPQLGGTHHGLQALGVGSNKQRRERAARLALAAVFCIGDTE